MGHFSRLDMSNINISTDRMLAAKRIGMLKLATDVTSEQDVQSMLPVGLELHSNRIPFPDPSINLINLKNLSQNICFSAENLLPGCDVDAVVFSCTSGAIAIGEGRLRSLLHNIFPSAPITNPVMAARAALSHLGALCLSIVTPYVDSVRVVVAKHFIEHGYKVQNLASLGLENDIEIQRISDDTIFETALRSCHSASDVLFISCTGLRTANVIARIEKELGKPVVTSNQAIAWHISKLLGCHENIDGFGSLLNERNI